MTAAHTDIPAGFAPLRTRSGFSLTVGPWYEKREGDSVVRGFRVDRRHINSLGIVHGGMMMSFADVLMGEAAWRATGRHSVTSRATVDFVDAGRLGDWIEGQGEITRSTRNLVFARARVWTGRRTLLTSSGVFTFIRARVDHEPVAGDVRP